MRLIVGVGLPGNMCELRLVRHARQPNNVSASSDARLDSISCGRCVCNGGVHWFTEHRTPVASVSVSKWQPRKAR